MNPKEVGLNLKKKQTIGTADAELALQEAERRKLELIEAMTQAAVAAIDDKKGLDLEVMKVTEKTTLADVFILASGSSGIHVKTLADAVEEKLEEEFDVRPGHIEGMEHRNWILLDYGDLVVHLMLPEDRTHYKLESLWRLDPDRQII